jgi:CMP-N-acetylneuraminic acid synthetase
VLRTLGLVPARGGSTRLERKNLARLGGRTLVRRALETSVAAACFDTVALSSDDPQILAEADGLDVLALSRPPELATAAARSFDVLRQVLRVVEHDHGRGPFEAVAIVQATSPFTAPEDVAGTLALLESSGAGSAVSVVRLEWALHPLKLKRLEGDRLVPYLEDDAMLPSQELPELWRRNGSVYASRREVIDAGTFIAEDVRGYAMPAERSHDIDTPMDLAFAEFLIERDPRLA